MKPLRPRPAQRGFTLVELLVALAIGILILAAVSVLFANHSGNQGELERTTRQVENARFALDLIGEDLMHSGYYGPFNPASVPVTYANPTAGPCPASTADLGWALTPASPQLATPLQGLSATDAAAATCLSNSKVRAGTQAVVVRHADTGNPITPATITAGNLYVQVSRCPWANLIDPTEKRIALTGSTTAAFVLPTLDCKTVNPEVRRVVQRTYFVASCNDCAANDGIPTLKRNEWIDGKLTVTAVAEGIENLQFEYGLDSDGDGQPDSYVLPSAITGVAPAVWENVVTARVYLLARSTQATPGYANSRTFQLGAAGSVTPTDSFKRTLLTSTVRLNNVGGRREK